MKNAKLFLTHIILFIRLVAIVFTVITSDMGIDVLKCYPTYVSATANHCKMVCFQ